MVLPTRSSRNNECLLIAADFINCQRIAKLKPTPTRHTIFLADLPITTMSASDSGDELILMGIDDAGQDFGAMAVDTSAPAAATQETVAEFFFRRGYSPVNGQRGGTQLLSAIKAEAVEHLARINKTWDDLDDAAQIKLVFIIVNRIDDHVLTYHTQPAQIQAQVSQSLFEAISNEKSVIYDRLEAFVQKGGDAAVDDTSAIEILEDFWKDKEWGDLDKATTIFTHSKDFQQPPPLIRYQTVSSSSVCYLLATWNLIYYSKYHRDQKAARSEHILNVNRFMRNEFHTQQMFDNIFLGHHPMFETNFLGHGGSCQAFLRVALGRWNPNKILFFEVVLRQGLSPSTIFELTQLAIRNYGALLIDEFKVIEAFGEKHVLEYDCSNYSLAEIQQSTTRHALVVVGVRLTESKEVKGGVEFLLQDSSLDKPFLTVSYDLLLAMDVTRFLALDPGLNIGPPVCPVDEPTRTTYL